MALLSLPNSLSGHVNATMPIIRDTTLYANSGISSIPTLTEERISLRTTQFIKKMSQTFFKQLDAPAVKSLSELLMFISKNGVDSIPQDALVKNAGYFTRFFSSESWQDWFKHTTRLGDVVRLYCDCVTSVTGLKAFMDRLDKDLLQVTNQDAALLLKSLQNEKKPTEPQVEHVFTTQSRSFWSSFLSLPVAEGQVCYADSFNTSNFPPSFDLSTLNDGNDFVLDSDGSDDGIADFVIGAYGDDSSRGQTYVIYGKKDLSSLDVNNLDGINGFVLYGDEFDDIGASVSGEDINQDSNPRDYPDIEYPRRK